MIASVEIGYNGDLLESSGNFSKFSMKQPVKFNDAIHNIQIDEKGAVAATSMCKFIYNFLFLIHQKKNPKKLFTAVYRGS